MTQTITTLANGDKQVVITGSETWAIPSDWNDAANKFEAYGGGGNGATGAASNSGGGGGASSTISTGGAGSTGVLVITYTPLTSSTPGRFFLFF